MKRLWAIASVIALLWGAPTIAAMSDRDLANEAAAVASTLLNKDMQSPEGMTLYNVARAIRPGSDNVLLIQGYLSRGKSPVATPSSYTAKKLAEQFRDRGVYLLKNHFRRNSKVAKLALLYLRVADQFIENDSQVVYGISYLQAYGFANSIDDLISETYDLDSIYRGSTAPNRQRVALSSTDVRVAKEALGIGSALLAKDVASTPGLVWLRLSNHLQPNEPKTIDVLNRIQRGMKIEPQTAKVTQDKLLKVMLSRAKSFYDKAKSSKKDAHMSLLYYRVCEQFMRDNKDVILGLVKLEQKLDKNAELDDLLNMNINDVFGTADDKSAGYATAGRGGSGRGGLIGSQTGPGPTYNTAPQLEAQDASAVDGKKLRIEGKTHRVRKNRYNDYYASDKIEETSLRAIVTNYVPSDVTDITIESYIIGQDRRNRKNCFIAEKVVKKGITIKKRNKYETGCKAFMGYYSGSSSGWGYSYTGFLIIVKDSKGKILNVESKDDFLERNAEKIMKYEPLRKSSISSSFYYYYSDGDFFDRDGNKR